MERSLITLTMAIRGFVNKNVVETGLKINIMQGIILLFLWAYAANLQAV